MFLSRRHILSSALGFGTTALLGVSCEIPEVRHWLALEHRVHFVSLGRHCLSWLPDLRSLSSERLCRELDTRLRINPGGDVSEVGTALGWSIGRDFCRGEIREVDGWCLSLTEALLAILAFYTFATTSEIGYNVA
jgi:hypothetical protein